MKTALIWNEIESLRYAIVEGDMSRFHDVYINSMKSDEMLQDELCKTIYDDDGLLKIKFCTLRELQDAVVDGAVLVEAGFLP